MSANVLPFLKKQTEAAARDIARWLLGVGPKPVGVLEDAYLAATKNRLELGIASTSLEVRLWEYAYGKPVELIEATVKNKSKLWVLSDEELAARIEYLMQRLKGTA